MQKKGKFLWFHRGEKDEKETTFSSGEEKLMNPAEERLRKKKRSKRKLTAVAAVLLAVILILQLWSRGVSKGPSISVKEEVLSYQVEKGDLDQTLKSSGVLANATEEAISIPGNIEVTSYLVKDGDTVKKGDPIAIIKRSSVMAALAELQELIDQLDQEISDAKEDSIASTIKATVDGTVVKVYATSGTDVVDTMYEKGALLLISLDGLLAVEIDNPGDVKVGSTLLVKDSDGNTHDGQVASIERDTIVVTVSLKHFSYGEKVTVLNSEKEKLGNGKLYIYSQQKITGYSGTVNSVKVAKGDTISEGDVLLTLSDIDNRATYQTLLNKRTALENQYNELVEIGNSGYVYGAADGMVSGIDETLLTDQAEGDSGFVATSAERTVKSSTNVGKISVDIEEGYSENTICFHTGFQNRAVKTGEAESSNDRVLMQYAGFIKTSEEISTTAESGATGKTANSEETTTGNTENPSEENSAGDTQNPSEGTTSGSQDAIDNKKDNTDRDNMPGGADAKKEEGQKVPADSMPNQTGNQGIGKEAGNQSALEGTQSSSSNTQTEEEDTKYEYGETTICYFIPKDTVEVEITVDELDIHEVKEGQQCTLTLDAFPSQSFTGTVNSVNKSGTNSGGNTKYTAIVAMEKEENMLTGMNASVQILLSTKNNVEMIPEAALVEKDGKVYVYTEYNKKTEELGGLVEVVTGQSDGEHVEILSGLEEGQQIYYRYAETISYTFS